MPLVIDFPPELYVMEDLEFSSRQFVNPYSRVFAELPVKSPPNVRI